MADILTQIVQKRKEDIARLGIEFGFELPKERARAVHSFLPSKGIILEVKRASPSKGDIAPDLDSFKTALSYAQSGAGAISCLTETNFFKGDLSDLMNVCAAVDEYERTTKRTGPAVLRKDFLLSEEEVDVAYRAGSDAVLLISRILDTQTMIKMAKRAALYGMTSLIELRLLEDVQKLKEVCREVDPKYIACGVNSRDLATFRIDLLKPCMLLKKIQEVLGSDARVIFESGIRTIESAAFVSALGFCGLLLGEAAAKNPSIRKELVESFLSSPQTPNALFWKNYANLLQESTLAPYAPFIKICGLTNKYDVAMCAKSGADFLGFIFFKKSPRHIPLEQAEEIISFCKQNAPRVIKAGVIVDLDSSEAKAAVDLCRRGVLDVLQIHGIDCARLFLKDRTLRSLPHYVAVNISCADDVAYLDELFEQGESRVLIDAGVAGIVGGTGRQIDAALVKEAQKKYPLWLAGGINENNAPSLVSDFCPELIDCASGTELTPGKKDFQKVLKVCSIKKTAR